MEEQSKKTKFMTKDIMKSAVIGSFQKLDPRYMIKNPVMFVVEIGFFITLVLTVFPTIFGDDANLRVYNGIVTVILVCHNPVCELCGICRRRTRKGTGRNIKEDKERYDCRSSDERWQREENQCIRTEKR